MDQAEQIKQLQEEVQHLRETAIMALGTLYLFKMLAGAIMSKPEWRKAADVLSGTLTALEKALQFKSEDEIKQLKK